MNFPSSAQPGDVFELGTVKYVCTHGGEPPTWAARVTSSVATSDTSPAPAGKLVAYQGKKIRVDLQQLGLVVALASAAVSHGVQAGNKRWHGGVDEFGYVATDGTMITMDAPQILQFGIVALGA